MNNSSSGGSSENGQPLPPGRALLVPLAIVVLLAGFVALGYALHIEAIFAGSLFVFFWIGIERADSAKFIAVLTGAIGGIANGSLLHQDVAAALGIDPGLSALAGLGLIMFAVYMLLIQKATTLFNHSYMLFLTVAAIPQLGHADLFVSMFQGAFISAAYFGVIFWALRRFSPRRDVDAAADAIASDG